MIRGVAGGVGDVLLCPSELEVSFNFAWNQGPLVIRGVVGGVGDVLVCPSELEISCCYLCDETKTCQVTSASL